MSSINTEMKKKIRVGGEEGKENQNMCVLCQK